MMEEFVEKEIFSFDSKRLVANPRYGAKECMLYFWTDNEEHNMTSRTGDVM